MRHIHPTSDLFPELTSILNPGRYLGGEYGQIIKHSADLTFALSFPDLYEIAMSNLAIKILYDGLNRIPTVRCERVFAPAPDFEALLKKKQIPLYTLESGIPLHETDILGISIGYEPGITGLLSILESGGVPLECFERSESHPIVLAGGCGITNPVPFARFIDAFFIGEAEESFFKLIEELSIIKRQGANRNDLLALISNHPAVWTAGKNENRKNNEVCTHRSIYSNFGNSKDRAVCFPIPNIKIVQEHGNVEIMRGCPNGCRFCHAGLYYRPQRMLSLERILSDVDYLVHHAGYREISLMSLSSGDFPGIDMLLTILNSRYANRNVSFQLPSLKVNSFTLPLLEKMSEVRKSGLTFAVETPVDAWQLSLNKEVHRDKIIEIIQEAKKRGWSKAKFYFMIGLPVEKNGQREEEEIVNFLVDIQKKTKIQCVVNIGVFIPKPHTPYQWSKQINMVDANNKLEYIRKTLNPGRFKVSTPHSFDSFVEAMMSRGDSRVGEIILQAFKKGCRLDAWDDWARPDIWKSVIKEASWNVEEETIRERSFNETLPWEGISLGVSKNYLKREKIRSDEQTLTSACKTTCDDPCGICGKKAELIILDPTKEIYDSTDNNSLKGLGKASYRVIISFTKIEEAAFIPHLGIVEIWSKAFQRSGLPVIFTQGFNPLPRFEIAQCLSLGISSDDEIASFLFDRKISSETVMSSLNNCLPENIKITRAYVYPLTDLLRRNALTKFLWGNRYTYTFIKKTDYEKVMTDDIIAHFISHNNGLHIKRCDTSDDTLIILLPIKADRPFRDLLSEIFTLSIYEIVKIHKISSLAINPDSLLEPTNFFDIFLTIGKQNEELLVYPVS